VILKDLCLKNKKNDLFNIVANKEQPILENTIQYKCACKKKKNMLVIFLNYMISMKKLLNSDNIRSASDGKFMLFKMSNLKNCQHGYDFNTLKKFAK
jgi:hypothetical protein